MPRTRRARATSWSPPARTARSTSPRGAIRSCRPTRRPIRSSRGTSSGSGRSSSRSQGADLAGRQAPVLADGQVADADRADPDPDELQDLASQGLDHAAHLAVPALGQRDLEDGAAGSVADAAHAGGLRRAVVERDPLPERIERGVVEEDRGFHEVRLRDLVLGVRERLGELGVVRQEEEAARVEVEPAHGEHVRSMLGQEVVDRLPSLRAPVRREVPLGLVEQEVDLLRGLEGLAVQAHAVPARIDPSVGVERDLAVDPHAALRDPASRLGSGADPRSREHAVERLRLCLFQRIAILCRHDPGAQEGGPDLVGGDHREDLRRAVGRAREPRERARHDARLAPAPGCLDRAGPAHEQGQPRDGGERPRPDRGDGGALRGDARRGRDRPRHRPPGEDGEPHRRAAARAAGPDRPHRRHAPVGDAVDRRAAEPDRSAPRGAGPPARRLRRDAQPGAPVPRCREGSAGGRVREEGVTPRILSTPASLLLTGISDVWGALRSGRVEGSQGSGLVLMTASAASFALMAAFVKRYLPHAPIQSVVLSRGTIMAAIFIAVARFQGAPILGKRPLVLLLRGLLGYAALSCYVWSVQHIPLGDAVLLQYSHPIFIAALAPFLLHEPTSRGHWSLVLTALLGVALIVSPSGELRSAALVGTLGSLLSALAYMTVRDLARTEHPLTILVRFPLATIPPSLLATLPAGRSALPAGASEVAGHLGVALAALVGQVALTLGLSRAGAARATAITLTGPVFGLLFGYVFFRTVPSAASLLGTAITLTAIGILGWRRT